MPVRQGMAIAYLAIAGFCLLSAVRDVASEVYFKNRLYEAGPVFVLFVFSIVTQGCAALSFLVSSAPSARQIFSKSTLGALLWLNIFTFAAFILYFLAIGSPIGASVNSFIDYGSGPIFTAIVGMVLTGERLNRFFAWSAFVSFIGVVILSAPRLQLADVSVLWLLGLVMALLSSLCGAFYVVYFKILLQAGLAKSAIIFLRLIMTTLGLGTVLVVRPELFRADIFAEIAVLGIFGFAAPLFLTLTILQRVTISAYAMLLFLVPVLTYLLSGALGYGRLFYSDLLAAGLIFYCVAFFERTRIR
jgi:drug/metabolite transporter (DMT)-like permease